MICRDRSQKQTSQNNKNSRNSIISKVNPYNPANLSNLASHWNQISSNGRMTKEMKKSLSHSTKTNNNQNLYHYLPSKSLNNKAMVVLTTNVNVWSRLHAVKYSTHASCAMTKSISTRKVVKHKEWLLTRLSRLNA